MVSLALPSRTAGDAERVASAVGGALLTLYGLSRRSLGGAALAGLGGVLAYRGATGRFPLVGVAGGATPAPVQVVEAVTVTVPRAEAYAFWRRLENLPRFMHHLRSVRDLGDGRSHWVAKGPGPLPDIEWLAEIIEEREGEVLAWRSLPGADVVNGGHVRFTDAPGGGTAVHVRISYHAPGGAAGAALARRLDPVFGQMVKEDVRRFKHVLEAGEVPTTDGQPSGRVSGSEK
jgi:uncharacterized membrane protein